MRPSTCGGALCNESAAGTFVPLPRTWDFLLRPGATIDQGIPHREQLHPTVATFGHYLQGVLKRACPDRHKLGHLLLQAQWLNGTTNCGCKTVPSYLPQKTNRIRYAKTQSFIALLGSVSMLKFVSSGGKPEEPKAGWNYWGWLPRILRSSKALTRARLTVSPQCRCGPVTRPVAPTFPRI